MSWNRCSRYIRTKIIKQLPTRERCQRNNDDQDKENLPGIFSRIPYGGAKGDGLLKNLTKKLNGPSLSFSY